MYGGDTGYLIESLKGDTGYLTPSFPSNQQQVTWLGAPTVDASGRGGCLPKGALVLEAFGAFRVDGLNPKP